MTVQAQVTIYFDKQELDILVMNNGNKVLRTPLPVSGIKSPVNVAADKRDAAIASNKKKIDSALRKALEKFNLPIWGGYTISFMNRGF